MISGTSPTDDSWVQIENSQVVDYSLKFDYYVVSYDEQNNKNVVTKGTLKENPGQYFMNNIDYYIDTLTVKNNPIYYNPVTGHKCNVGDENGNYNEITNSKIGFKGTDTNGCMKWYKYSVNLDGSVNVILDHNTNTGVLWSNIENNNNQKAENALKVMNGLLEDNTTGDTTLWSDKLIREDKYKATWKQNIDEDYVTTEIDYTGHKARLITAQEIAAITHAQDPSPNGIGFNENTTTYDRWFYLDGNKGDNSYEAKRWQKQSAFGQNSSSYSWLFDNLASCVVYGYGCSQQQGGTGNYGYWTSTPATNSLSYTWLVYFSGTLLNGPVTISDYGVRPVITIKE